MQEKRMYQLWKISILLFVAIVFTFSLIRCAQKPETFVSLSPSVQYTGDASCQSCHKKIFASYKETGMGRALYRPDTTEIIEAFGPEALVYDAFLKYYYLPFYQQNELFVKEFQLTDGDTSYQRIEKVDYIVGSGHQTRSYLLERNGYLYEVPITWYVSKQIWDLSPGYDAGQNSRFSREIGEDCMACHTGAFDYVKGSKHRYREVTMGIDCERCHGPGEAHVKAMKAGKEIDVGEYTDYTIVNPAKLPLNKQFDVCQQCHLQGLNVLEEGKSVRDFRPGMDLNDVYHIFLKTNPDSNAFGIASHAERLQQSQCFIQSEGKLTCTTCHDPHKSIAVTDEQIYIRQCQSCHQPNRQIECGLDPQVQMLEEGNCISCHMPQGGTNDIPHVSFHDHKIRVLDTADISQTIAEEKEFIEQLFCANDSFISDSILGKAYLLHFEKTSAEASYLEQAAKLLPAQGNLYEKARIAFYQQNFPKALSLINQAMQVTGLNPLLLFQKGEIHEAIGEYEKAFQAFSKAYQLNGEAFEAGLKSGTTLLLARAGQAQALTDARAIFEKLYQLKPFDPRLLTNLGFVAMNQQRFDEAEGYFVKALKLEPHDLQALENMIFLHVTKGNTPRAQFFFDRLIRSHPDYAKQEVVNKLING
jgi:tetratricopeptide (TPR) repeat protein